jgi:DNA-binding LytR/AlgR family response regulator
MFALSICYKYLLIMQQFNYNSHQQFYQLSINSIVRIESVSNYTKIICCHLKHPIVIPKVLHLLLKELPENNFVRIHRAHAINIDYLKNIKKQSNSFCELTNGEIVSISRRKFKNLAALL